MQKSGYGYRWLVCCASILLLVGCASVTDGVASFMGPDSKALNTEIARSYADLIAEAKKSGKLDTTSATAQRVHQVFNALMPHANRENRTGVNFAWEVNVIRSPELNAWAMPGGKMAFYSGIVEKLKLTNAEIAAIMGHEMSHALKEHTKKKIATQKTSEILISLALKAGSITGKGELDNILAGLTKQFALDLPFSRSNEAEADAIGLMLMAQAGYDPQAAVSLWLKMDKASQNKIPGFMSTHPTHGKRIDNLKKLMPQALVAYQQAPVKRK